jgi:hypothetical protein
MGILAILPMIWDMFKSIGLPLLDEHKSSIISKIASSGIKDLTSGGFVSIVESVFGKIEDSKKAQITMQIDSILGNIQLDQAEESKGWNPREYLFWGLSTALLLSVLVEPTIQWLAAWVGFNAPPPFVLSPLVMGIICSLLGVQHISHKLGGDE